MLQIGMTLISLLLLFFFRSQIFDFASNHLIKLVVYVAFIGILFSFTSTIFAFTFYHFSVALSLGLGPFLNQWTVGLLTNFVLSVPLFIVGKIIVNLFAKN